ncbi:MAG: c-type cytochrome [Legionellales bacterium]
MRLCFLLLLSFFSWVLYANDDANQGLVQQDLGQETYEHFCIACHQEGVVGAPKFRDENDWKQRLTGKTMDDLVSSAVNGLNVMPAQGTCSECSKDDLKAAIQYMLPKP